MRKYGAVHCCYWDWAKRHKISDEAKMIGAYLLSCDHGNSLGCFKILKEYVSADLGYSINKISIGFKKLEKLEFFIHCETTNFGLLIKYLKYNPCQNPKHAKGMESIIESIPEDFEHWLVLLKSLELSRYPIDTLSIPYRYKDQYQNQNQDQDTDQEIEEAEEEKPPEEEVVKIKYPDIVNIYNELCPFGTQCKQITDERREHLNARISEDKKRSHLKWWREFFTYIAKSKFLRGEIDPNSGFKQFKLTFDWVINPNNLVKIIEKKYHNNQLSVKDEIGYTING